MGVDRDGHFGSWTWDKQNWMFWLVVSLLGWIGHLKVQIKQGTKISVPIKVSSVFGLISCRRLLLSLLLLLLSPMSRDPNYSNHFCIMIMSFKQLPWWSILGPYIPCQTTHPFGGWSVTVPLKVPIRSFFVIIAIKPYVFQQMVLFPHDIVSTLRFLIYGTFRLKKK